MNVYIATDHGGYELKNEIIKNKIEGINFIDLGAEDYNKNDDYPIYAKQLANELQQDRNSFGILICRSGIGMSIAANKFKNIYAALCFTSLHAKKAREHNNANVLCLDSDYGELETHLNIVRTFLESRFDGNQTRHERRFKEIKDIENENFKD